MKEFNLDNIIRKNIKTLIPYSSARSEFEGTDCVFLDANENAVDYSEAGYNRYPDPLQLRLKQRISEIKNIAVEHIFLGNGSDEPIDLLIRATCTPEKDNIIICPPTYGMYEVAAKINNVLVKEVLLTDAFELDIENVLLACTADTKLIFICSPNNPTGNLISSVAIERLLSAFNGLVVLDEAYIDYAPERSWLNRIVSYPNLVILQTFSKAWGMAALRLGMAFCSKDLVGVLNKIKPPYNINTATQELTIEILDKEKLVAQNISQVKEQRKYLVTQLLAFHFVVQIFPSAANFLLLRVTDADQLYQYLLRNRIVVRNRSKLVLCENCLRVTIGTAAENELLINALKRYENEKESTVYR